jgi:hypothetical protein
MEENLFQHFPELEKLLETKEFTALSEQEKMQVLQMMTADEYRDYHLLIMKSKRTFSVEEKFLLPNPSIREDLLARINPERQKSRKQKNAGVFSRLYSFRIPAYQPAFAVAVLVVLFFLFRNERPETIRYLTKIDTIYLEKEVTQNKNLSEPMENIQPEHRAHGIKHASNHQQKTISHRNVTLKPGQNQYIQNAYQKIRLTESNRTGSNAKDDSALMKLLVTAN